MLINKKQEKAIELLSCMEVLALEKGMKIRILDKIRELKEQLEIPLTELELDRKVLEIDELVNNMWKQVFSDTQKENIVDELTTVSREEIRITVEETIEESFERNKSLLINYINDQETYIEESERLMKEIGNVQAQYNQIQNMGIFCKFFEQIGKKLNLQIASSASKFIEIAFQNCDTAILKISNILSYVQDKTININKQKLYHIYDTENDLVKLKAKANDMEYGGKCIEKFGKEHIKNVEKILNQKKRKRKFYKLLPIIIVLIIGIPKIGNMIKQADVDVIENIDTMENGTKVENLLNTIKNTIEKIDAIEKLLSSVQNAIEIGIIIVVIILSVLLIACIIKGYRLYIQAVNRWYKKWVCSALSSYLTVELEKFWEGQLFKELIKKNFNQLSDEIEEKYKKLLDDILSQTSVTEPVVIDSNEIRFQELYKEWNVAKRLS